MGQHKFTALTGGTPGGVTRSGTTRLHRRAQARREAGRRGSTHPGAHPSKMVIIANKGRTRIHAQRREMRASHELRGPGGTHFNQDRRATGDGLPIAPNPGLKLLWDNQALAKRVTTPRTPTTTTHVQTIASVLGEKYAKVEPVSARRRGTGRPASPLLRIP
jgi:hypothetical protein